MSYTIIVKRTESRIKKVSGDWVILKQGVGQTPPEMGYAPERQKIVDIDEEIYSQTVDDLDLAAVVSVVNSLPAPQLAPPPTVEIMRSKFAIGSKVMDERGRVSQIMSIVRRAGEPIYYTSTNDIYSEDQLSQYESDI